MTAATSDEQNGNGWSIECKNHYRQNETICV